MQVFDYYCNGLFDPQVSLGGHQPMGFDQIGLYYGYVTVTGAKITTKWTVNDSSLSVPVMVGTYGPFESGTPTIPTSWRTMKESGFPMSQVTTYANKPVTSVGKFSFRKFFKTSPNGSLQQTANTQSSNAVRLATWRLWFQPTDQTSAVEAVNCEVIIDYLVYCSNKTQLPPS